MIGLNYPSYSVFWAVGCGIFGPGTLLQLWNQRLNIWAELQNGSSSPKKWHPWVWLYGSIAIWCIFVNVMRLGSSSSPLVGAFNPLNNICWVRPSISRIDHLKQWTQQPSSHYITWYPSICLLDTRFIAYIPPLHTHQKQILLVKSTSQW